MVSLCVLPSSVHSHPLLSRRVEHIVSPNSQFSFTSNASSIRDSGIVLGDLYVDVNPNQTVQDITVSIKMQTSSSSVFDRTFVCFALSDNVTDLSLYVCISCFIQILHLTSVQIPANLSSSDNILFNITLLFPQSPVLGPIEAFGTFLPLFYQHFGSLSNVVSFKKISIEGPTSSIAVDVRRSPIAALVDQSLTSVISL